MKLSEAWLREWVNPALTREQLCHELTMAGLEVDELAPVSAEFSHVVIGKVASLEKHPEADRLHVCQVDIGKAEHLQIVCGAANVKKEMLVAVAMVGAILPGDKSITAANLRGVASQGMLCSAKELGLAEESEGLMALPTDAPLGANLHDYLQLNDYIIDISITPNRGDCLCIKGVARDLSAITNTPWQNPTPAKPVKNTITDEIPIKIQAPAACPRYVGRIIRDIKGDVSSPVWLKEKLRRSGIRSIHPVVDVTNYVMLELGQPMHAFDLDTIQQNINVRMSVSGEKIALLDGSEKTLDDATLVIADQQKTLAIAGVMGGLESCVTTLTKDILLESAYFDPKTIARQRQHHQLNSDSAYRFERGVDYTIQRDAIERATQLILEITGGKAGPVIECEDKSQLPSRHEVTLHQEKLNKTLGITIDDGTVTNILSRLGFTLQNARARQAWTVNIPSFRFDISQPEDLIEEIARLHGYNKIPTHTLKGDLQAASGLSTDRDLSSLKQAFTDHGYHEIISYSFVDKQRQQLLDPDRQAMGLVNPISAEMNVMRTNLWPGLLNTLKYNQSRQQNDIRLFETGLCFIQDKDKLAQVPRLGGVISGRAQDEQWGIPTRKVDFYDLKGHLEDIFTGILSEPLAFQSGEHPALHPGQTAWIYQAGKRVGIMGTLHPSICQSLDLPEKAFVFEFDLASLTYLGKSLIQEVSKFPEIRRDIAILVNQTVPGDKIQDTIKRSAGDWLKDVFIFDVYQGKGISPGLKSIALALIWQHPTRTLVDEEVTAAMERVTDALKGNLGAELRS